MRRTASPASVSSLISNGGVSAREKMCSRVGFDLDLAGRQLRVDVVPPREMTRAGDADAELRAQLAGERVRLRVDVGLEDDLGDAAAIAQIDEDAAAVIAARGHPAEEDDVALADVGGAQRAAVVGALQIDEELRAPARACEDHARAI